MPIRGVIFDMDGTLVDSGLDFDLMRREMGIAGSPPLLETLAGMPPDEARRCWEIIHRHERLGAERAVAYAGVPEFLDSLAARGLRMAVVTRNGRAASLATLARLGLEIELVVCREDGPVKPHPAAIWKVCATWGIEPGQCVMIGDYRFDIEAARHAGAHAVLFSGGGGPSGLEHDALADLVLASFADPAPFWAWLAQIDLGAPGGSC